MFDVIEVSCILKSILRNSSLLTLDDDLIRAFRNGQGLHLESFNLLLKISYDKSFKHMEERKISRGIFLSFLLFLGFQGTDTLLISTLQFALLLLKGICP